MKAAKAVAESTTGIVAEHIIANPEKDTEKKETGTVEFRNVSFSYQDTSEKCISDISFKINPGKIIGLVSPNGSGKTTLIKLIMELIKVDEGTITVDGKKSGAETRNVISYLPDLFKYIYH